MTHRPVCLCLPRANSGAETCTPHSTRSDGVLSPEEVCRRYRAEGYDFLALTDHFVGLWNYPIVDTVPFRAEGFTTILGAELHSGAMTNGELWHILAVGLPADFAPSNSPDFVPRADQETAADLAARAVAAGAFVAIAHPQWSGLTLADARGITAAHAVEVYNHGCAAGCDRPDGFAIADLLLTEGRQLSLIATDDAHFSEPDHFGGWVMVKAEENAPDALLAALKRGDFYSSQGPEPAGCAAGGRQHRGGKHGRVVGDRAGMGHRRQGRAWPFDDAHRGAAGAALEQPVAAGQRDRCGGQAGLVKSDLAGCGGRGTRATGKCGAVERAGPGVSHPRTPVGYFRREDDT